MTTVTTTPAPAKTKNASPVKGPKTNSGKNSHAVATHTTTTFAGFCNVIFHYDDETKEPVRNRFVAYWAYDTSGSKIDTSPLNQQSLWGMSLLYPVGVGKTDKDGNLLPAPAFDGQIAIRNSKGLYSITSDRSPAPGPKAAEGMQPFGALFPMGKKVGFVLCPIDMLKTFETGELEKLTTKQGAVFVTMEGMDQVVSIKASLPDWQYRIQVATATLKKDIDNYQKYTKKHYESIGQLEMLSTVASNMNRFPAEQIKAEEVDSIKNLIIQIDDLKDLIGKLYITNTSANSLCGKFLAKIDGSAKKILDLLRSKDFIKELKKYIHFLDDATSKGVTFPVESDWLGILETIKDAYVELSKTSLSEKIFNGHIAPFLAKIARIGAEGKPEWNEPTSIEAPAEMPLMVLIDRVGAIIQAVATPAPGTATMIEGIVDAFGMGISRWMSGLPKSQAKLPKDLLYGMMRIFKGGKALSLSEKGVLAKAAYSGRLADGRKALYDFSKEYMEKSFGEVAAKMFSRLMFIFALVTLYNAMGSNENDTLKFWLTISATAPPAAAAALQAFFSKFLEKQLFRGTKAAMKLSTAAGSLAAIAGIAASIISFMDAKEAYHNYESFKGAMLVAQGISSILLTAGYFLMLIGAGTSWGGFGIVLAAVGAVVYVGTSIILLVKDLIEEGTYQVYKQIMEEFSKDGSTFKLVYSKESSSNIEKKFEDLKRTVNSMHWWDLSWRAIAPLFCSGFKAYRESGNEVLYGESAKLISKMIKESSIPKKKAYYRSDYGKEYLVLDYINEFLRAQKNNEDYDHDGVPDAVEWMNGTMYPDDPPRLKAGSH